MTPLERRLFHGANALVAATGLVYAWMAYLLAPPDEYAIVNHPLQPLMQHAHVAVAPPLVLMLGVLWRGHVWPRWRSRAADGRRTGLALIAMLAPMLASGYALQVSADPRWRTAWVVVHLISSALWLAVGVAHFFAVRAHAKRRRNVAVQAQPIVDGAASSVTRG